MIKVLKKICGILGYKLLPKNYIKNERYLSKFAFFKLEKILLDLVEKKIINSLIQIGANDGSKDDPLVNIIKKFRLRCLLLEPIKKYFLLLQNNYLNYENVKLENSALSVNNEIRFLYKVNPRYFNKYGTLADVISSFYKDHLIKHEINEKHIIKEKVSQIGFDELLKKYSFEKFDLLIIDTEGYDCHIVDDFFLKIKKVRPIVVFEWSHIKNKDLENTLSSLTKNNYSFFPVENDIFCFPIEKNILF
jgi:FkbM family methyltransferase